MTTSPEPVAPLRSYRPGDWFGIVGQRAVVALPASEKSRVPALWELVDGGAGFDVTLDAILSGGLRDLPAFVLVSTLGSTTQLVLRGDARAELEADGEVVVVEGGGAATWVERTVAGVQRLGLVLGPQLDSDFEGGGPAYTVDGGLFRLSRFEESPAHVGADETTVEPAYEREFPLAPPAPADIDVDTEPELDAEPGLESPPAGPSRSPEPPSWTPGAPPTPPPAVVDHDGMTVSGSWQPPPPVPPGIPGQPPAPDVTRPVARLELSTGEAFDVDRAIVFGRAPTPRRYSPTEEPLLVTVPSPRLEVSSTHLEVRPGTGADHGSAVATDLGSTNGTVLVQSGLGAQDLTAGETVQLMPGAVLDLGDGVQIRVVAAGR